MSIHWRTWQHALLTAELKFQRAQECSSAALEQLAQFELSKPYRLIGDGRYSTHFWSLEVNTNLPPTIMMYVGDAVHNWRSALDHCAYAFWKMDNSILNTSKLRANQVYFPIAKDRKEFSRKIQGLGLYNDATVKFLEFEAYDQGAGDSIYCLSMVDNIDKHRLILPAKMIVEISDMYIRSSEGNMFAFEERLGPINIEVLSKEMTTTLISRLGMEIFGIHNFPGIDARLERYVDESKAKAKIHVELAEHIPLINHHCGRSLRGSLTAFSIAVSGVLWELKDVLGRRIAA